MYRAVTRAIAVTVTPAFMSDRSAPSERLFFWSYTIAIRNDGDAQVQLLTRHWIIADATGRVQEVKGEGVIGQQPKIAPGETFEYTSGVPLQTPSGFMRGSYRMTTADGETFDIEVPAFSLDGPETERLVLN